MEDAQIIDHFFRRDPEAITAVQEKYEKRCLAAARHILPDDRDAEECVNDTYLRTWNAIPPARPSAFRAWLGRIVRISPPSPAAWPWTSATITAPPSAAAT